MSEEAQRIWNYISNNQDTDFKILAKELGLSLKLMQSLIFDWALGDKEMFEKHLNT